MEADSVRAVLCLSVAANGVTGPVVMLGLCNVRQESERISLGQSDRVSIYQRIKIPSNQGSSSGPQCRCLSVRNAPLRILPLLFLLVAGSNLTRELCQLLVQSAFNIFFYLIYFMCIITTSTHTHSLSLSLSLSASVPLPLVTTVDFSAYAFANPLLPSHQIIIEPRARRKATEHSQNDGQCDGDGDGYEGLNDILLPGLWKTMVSSTWKRKKYEQKHERHLHPTRDHGRTNDDRSGGRALLPTPCLLPMITRIRHRPSARTDHARQLFNTDHGRGPFIALGLDTLGVVSLGLTSSLGVKGIDAEPGQYNECESRESS
ncbi:uncharacterized protein MYCFIDRAFT_175063 [Pseudocercospora fijiensis CIRAD86]|uniref:Uncharacterized protein n=1 Tax=Pseudocercospora fijiensis (strain CIRAD86) TaxID=383855 RepID=M3AGC5_PSEFD|nr:uncharacterized protein MYCFIDRAFT_175063 [Pseudocercospora fijiensis CIRAD86]EME83636.1 hypothetical protein MYCFIDRAFT_175063 [Pseudocercospora fijiensis CIRAD86]